MGKLRLQEARLGWTVASLVGAGARPGPPAPVLPGQAMWPGHMLISFGQSERPQEGGMWFQ